MNIVTIIFTYNRSWHTKQVLDALKKNTVLPEKMVIFQDGLKNEEHREEWERVNEIITKVEWCDCETVVSEKNKGLAESVVLGINWAFERYDAVIVLEDDCVPNINFIKFMYQCLNKYQKVERVHSVSGYAWPIDIPRGKDDIYFCGRISSWGWGTWKNRWATYERDYNILRHMKNDVNMSKELETWGSDLEDILLGNIRGETDSWAVFWALHAIQNHGVCINPYQSLIQNIGFDNTGVHCGNIRRFEVQQDSRKEVSYELPDVIQVLDTTRKAFASLYGSYTAVKEEETEGQKTVVYGLGKFYLKNECSLNENYNIQVFVDKHKKEYVAGKKIITLSQLSQYTFDKIIIMVQNMKECINIVGELLNIYGVPYDKIILGHSMYGVYSKEFEAINVMPDGSLKVCANGIEVKVHSLDEFNNVREVLVEQCYRYFVNNDKRDVVLDVGMNIGDATLFFLKNSKTEKVYAYEPFQQTFINAQENLDKYKDTGKVAMFQFGISGQNEIRRIGFNKDMTCGQSSLSQIRQKTYEAYCKNALVKDENEIIEQIEVRNVSEVFEPIISQYPQCNIILKMDCEGEEYAIMDELVGKKLLARIDFIMMEWHYRGKESILQYLEQAGFSYWCSDKNSEMGLIYAYNTRKSG